MPNDMQLPLFQPRIAPVPVGNVWIPRELIEQLAATKPAHMDMLPAPLRGSIERLVKYLEG